MKKLAWLLAIFVVATAIHEAYQYFAPVAEAYRSYREEARAQVLTRKDDSHFRGIEGNVLDVSYSLESAERQSDGTVRIVVIEAIQFQKATDLGLGNRRIAKTRQQVIMRRFEGRWVVSDLMEDQTEVTELGKLVE